MTYPSYSKVAPLGLICDEPIIRLRQDKLRLHNLARLVARIATEVEGPFTVGIFGGWGEGKTSVLQLAKGLVDESRQAEESIITTVEFNAWQYERENLPLIPLIATIVYQLDAKQNVSEKLKDGMTKLKNGLRSILRGLSAGIDIKIPGVGNANVKFDASKSLEYEEKLRSQWLDKQIEQSLYYNSLRVLQRQRNKIKVIVFIDDLDRCFPDKAIQLLESIKLVLNQPGFIFIMAVDQRVLNDYLEKRFEEFGFKDYHQSQSYLDKIFQLRLWIQSHEQWFKDLVRHYCLDRLGLSKYYGAYESFDDLVSNIASACLYNPRRLIRLVNDLMLAQLIEPEENLPFNSCAVARSLFHHNHDTYEFLLNNSKLCNMLRECENPDKIRNLLESLRKELPSKDPNDNYYLDLINHDVLLRLLSSEPGKEWLKNHWLRNTADMVLKPMSKLDQYAEDKLEEALEQIETGDEEVINIACDTIYAYYWLHHSLRYELNQKLEELCQSDNKWIRDKAVSTLDAIDKVKNKLEEALEQIETGDEEVINIACDTIRDFYWSDHPLRLELRQKLEELCQSDNKQIKDKAVSTLDAIDEIRS